MSEDKDSESEKHGKVEQPGQGGSPPAEAEGVSKEETKRKRKRKRKKKAAKEEDDVDDTAIEPSPSAHDPVECTVYVEGMPFDASQQDLKQFFESDGISDIVELRLPTWQDSGRLRGYGHILFGSKDSYEKALTLSGKYMGKRYLTIMPANSPKASTTSHVVHDGVPPTDCSTLFVSNLPYMATEVEILDIFQKIGDISEDGVRIARNSVTRQSKGFCYIDFVSPKDAQKVMKAATKKNISVGGRCLRLDYDTGRMKGSYRAESGRLWSKESKEQEQKRQRVHK